MKEYSTDEKIDFIFNELKIQKRNRTIKIILRIIFISLLIYFYFTLVDSFKNKDFSTEVGNIIGEIVTPITQDIVDNMVKNTTTKDVEIPKEVIEKYIKDNY